MSYLGLASKPSSGKEDAKTLIVQSLSKSWPLTSKQLHSKISSISGSKPLTYQAIHKAAQELLSDGTLVSDSAKGYSLSLKWVEEQERAWRKTLTNYSGGSPPSLKDIRPGESVSHTFKGIISVPYWVIDEIPPIAAHKSFVAQHVSFAWPSQMVDAERHKKMKLFSKSLGNYTLCRGKSPGDIYCLKYVEKVLKVKWKAGMDVASESDMFAFNDYVVNIYWPTAHKLLMKAAFSHESIAKGMQVAYDYVLAGVANRMDVPVVITRNKSMANQIIAETKAYFKGSK